MYEAKNDLLMIFMMMKSVENENNCKMKLLK